MEGGGLCGVHACTAVLCNLQVANSANWRSACTFRCSQVTCTKSLLREDIMFARYIYVYTHEKLLKYFLKQ